MKFLTMFFLAALLSSHSFARTDEGRNFGILKDLYFNQALKPDIEFLTNKIWVGRCYDVSENLFAATYGIVSDSGSYKAIAKLNTDGDPYYFYKWTLSDLLNAHPLSVWSTVNTNQRWIITSEQGRGAVVNSNYYSKDGKSALIQKMDIGNTSIFCMLVNYQGE